ncbi:unnamed protein product (macronuclear) [Paramecium tetraurelia]|uniref:C2HC/C3H-type domain-containing protein n=1 Tax=Paramecium tetraurelia TaxID=5888 RepID=A0D6H1_PARTE|nr:uncharacterized protein GSPATT00001679001 [Paramecium tetraurelia]CAK78638.1 unnamed protein product [Paramecium tetraurelia]|eukprot:XP_001446035.1 hypothetical protein (macronuclear) [Paramecium tetraurelia strain d4-2]
MNYKPNLKMDSTSGSFKKQEQTLSLESTQKSEYNGISIKPNFACKPTFNIRNRSPQPQEQEPQLTNTKDDFFKTGTFQEKIPLKDRIQRSDEKKNTAPVSKGLYLPGQEELFRKQIQVEKKETQQPQEKKDVQSVKTIQGEYYMPSIGQQQNKREAALLGSKNPLENKLAVANQERVLQQLEEAEPIEELELLLCPEGCGRQFKSDALEKHVKVCRQVFQQKRQEFNSKQARVVTNDQQKLQRQGQIKEKQLQKKQGKAPLDPNWKKQSEELRNLIKESKQQQ